MQIELGPRPRHKFTREAAIYLLFRKLGACKTSPTDWHYHASTHRVLAAPWVVNPASRAREAPLWQKRATQHRTLGSFIKHPVLASSRGSPRRSLGTLGSRGGGRASVSRAANPSVGLKGCIIKAHGGGAGVRKRWPPPPSRLPRIPQRPRRGTP